MPLWEFKACLPECYMIIVTITNIMQLTVNTWQDALLQKEYFRCNWKLQLCTENDNDCAKDSHCDCWHRRCTTSLVGFRRNKECLPVLQCHYIRKKYGKEQENNEDRVISLLLCQPPLQTLLKCFGNYYQNRKSRMCYSTHWIIRW